jgi:hypothetical protein
LLIAKAIEPNPRQVKRFINNIILAKAVFGEDIDYDKLIVVKALNFRREWNKFLESISVDDKTRADFFKKHYIPPTRKGRSITNQDALKSYIKEQDGTNEPLSEEMINIFQELVKEGNQRQASDSLRDFLNAGADEILRDINDMEKYRRALEATRLEEEAAAKKRIADEIEQTRRRLLREMNEIEIWASELVDKGFLNKYKKALEERGINAEKLLENILEYLRAARNSLADGDIAGAEYYIAQAFRSYDKLVVSFPKLR